MTDVTSATATFLFTDIEGSTQLLKAHRGEYPGILADHHRLLRDAFSAYGGREVDNQGDSFFVAFPRARDAVLAAATAQRKLAEHNWPGGATVRVRMGIHTGEADLAADRYVGMSVHRAARISSVGHGGQVLVSPTTAGHLEDGEDLPGVALRDLGEHRLKDISRPVRLHQLDIEGLPGDFPPLTSEPREPDRRKRWILAGVAAVALAAAAVAALWLSRDAPPPEILPNSLVRIDPQTLEPTQVIPVADAPDFVDAAGGYVWITHHILSQNRSEGEVLQEAGDRVLTRVDPSTGEAVIVGGGLAPCGMTADPSGDLWVVNCSTEGARIRSKVVRIDAKTLRFEATWPIRSYDPAPYASYRGAAYGGGALWVTVPQVGVERVDPATGDRQLLALDDLAGDLAWSEGYGTLWGSGDTNVSRVNPATGEVKTLERFAVEPFILDADGDAVWVADFRPFSSRAAQVWRLNAVGPPDARRTSLPVETSSPFGVVGVAVGEEAVWATVPDGDRTVWRIDPSTNLVTRIPFPYPPFGVVADNESVWVAVRSGE